MRLASNLLSVVVAATLLFSGIVHASEPYYFVHTVGSYHLLPSAGAGVVGILFPYIQIVLGICIGLQIAESVALGSAAFLFAIYASAQLSVLMRGLDIDCGCFGTVALKVSPTSALVPALLLAACVLSLKWKSTTFSSEST